MVNNELKALPIVDKIMKDYHGRIVNFVEEPYFTFGKELQLHVMEIKPNKAFQSPRVFEDIMQKAVSELNDFLQRKYNAHLLGTGMHPFLKLEETGVWPHRDRQIYQAYRKVFNLKRHGWLNIQSFQLNLPYADEKSGINLHNILTSICAYLPAIAASSPIYEGRLGNNVDNRMDFYRQNQKEVPSITGEVVPEYASAFKQYRKEVIAKYSSDMAKKGAPKLILGRDWVNSRGVVFRFDRKALEVRVMDEQECVKSDVALSCYVRALARAMLNQEEQVLSHETLVSDFNTILADGLNAKTKHPGGHTAREVCRTLLRTAWNNASKEEKDYLPVIEKRVERGSLSEIVREKVRTKAQRTDFTEAVVAVYSKLGESLMGNQPYF